MPGTTELDLIAYVTEFAADQIETIKQELDELNQAAWEQYQHIFADLEADDRDALVERLRSENAQFAQRLSLFRPSPVITRMTGWWWRWVWRRGRHFQKGTRWNRVIFHCLIRFVRGSGFIGMFESDGSKYIG